eukprot:4463560-Lingulodinium_polyedra.AAC.1
MRGQTQLQARSMTLRVSRTTSTRTTRMRRACKQARAPGCGPVTAGGQRAPGRCATHPACT